jgi:hypothetical protein
VRFAVSLDGATPVVVDTATAGRSEQWKEDMLSNMAVRTWRAGQLKPGMHTLTVRAPDYYGMPPVD